MDQTNAELYGRRIASARVLRGKTQHELANAIGVSVRTIVGVESGQSILRADRVAKIARKLRVSTDYLLGLTENMSPKQLTHAGAGLA